MNIFEEEKYYASMVRKYKSEDHQQSLQEFCKKEHLSYTKMLNTLRLSEQQWQQRQDSYRRRKINRQTQPRHEESGFKPLIIDAPQEQDTREPEKPVPNSEGFLEGIELLISERVKVNVGRCDVATLLSLLKGMEIGIC